MPFIVHWLTAAGALARHHPHHTPAIEHAMDVVGLGATEVCIVTATGRVYRAPAEMLDLMQHARAAEAAAPEPPR